MKNIFRVISFLLLLSMFAFKFSNAQVTVSGASSGNGTYSTLSAAFTAINGGAQTNASIQISITANTTEPSGGAILNNGAWNSISIKPGGGAARTITGAATAGLPLIDFNGADKVTIDGLNSGGNSLTISNTTASATSGTSTIRFQNDATNNVIQNCNILGSSTMAVNIDGGNIWFGSNSSLTGNDNNVITFCNIGPAGSNLPTKGIFFSGTTTDSTLNNSGNLISNCNIFDYFKDSTTSAGIYAGTGTTSISIENNKFYQTASRTQLTGNQHSAIWIANTSGNNFTISGNIIGSASNTGTGTYTLTGISGNTSTKLYPVYIEAGTTASSSIQGNTIHKMTLSGSITGTDNSPAVACIMVNAGLVNIGTTGGNTIGSQSDTSSISYASSSVQNSDICGIYIAGTGNNTVSNNNIGGITVSNSNTGTCIIYSCRANNLGSTTETFQNNAIGGTVANSIHNKSNGANTRTFGIYSNGPKIIATGNTVRNLTSAGGTGININSSVSGITVVTGNVNHVLSQNTIYQLKNSNSTNACFVNGIFYNSGAATISRNFIHTLMVGGNNSTMSGIHFNGGSAACQNNMIRMGLDTSGNSLSTGCVINGINETGGANNFYFNSIYLGGAPTSSANNTFAFASNATGTRINRNNIFYNARSNNGSTGKHYAVTIGSTTNITINNNVYLANGSGGVLGLLSGNDYSTLSAWRTAVGQDANSFESNPQFINPNGSSSSVDLHINASSPTIVESNGFNVVTITDDFDGQTRSSLTPVDIGADAGDFTKAPVIVSGALTVNGYYLTLSEAFSAINSVAQTSANISITINADITEPSTGAVLNSGAWTSLTIQPAGGASRTVSANVNEGLPLIDLNGADYVTIDGLNSSGNFLTISNTSTSGTEQTSTIRFRADATNNKITNCSVLGSATMEAGQPGGNIFFASGSSSGNNNNVISFCDIGPAGSNLPSQCVVSYAIVIYNSADTIRNCSIFDYFHSSVASSGVAMVIGSTDMVIKNNKFYQTAIRTQTSGNRHSAIYINEFNGKNFTVSGNTIGSASGSGAGTYSMIGVTGSTFYPIYIDASTTETSNVDGNLIHKISMSGPLSIINVFASIYSPRGLIYIGTIEGNTIGSQTDTSSISISSSSSLTSEVNGIYMVASSNNATISNNNIGGITTSNSGGGAILLNCVKASLSSSQVFTLTNNVIGGTNENSINNKSNANLTTTNGLYCIGSSVIVTGNTIRNLTSAGGTSQIPSVNGIFISSPGTVQTVSQNKIYNLKNTNQSLSCSVNGISYLSGSNSAVISRNFIHSLIIGGNTSTVTGLQANGGTVTYENNMIQLGLDTSGNSINEGASIIGINEASGTNNFYFNSVYIGGSPASGSNNTFAFSSSVTSNTRNFRDNIFYNARSNNGSTGKHYAVTVAGTSPNPSGLTINYNIYFANGSGGVFGLFNGADVANLAAWQTAVGQDANSYQSNPEFINPNGSASTADLHINPTIPTDVEGNGVDIVSITVDYDGQIRSGLTPVDIGADAGNFTATKVVSVSGAISGNGNYTTLSSAFNAINAAAQTSANILIKIKGDITESSAGAVLNSGAWTSLSIQPDGGAARTISASVNAGSPLIDFNGADNVTIDGLNTGGNSLAISNTSVSSTAGTSTVRFRVDATNNKITNCSILGSSATTVTNNGGTIWFAASSTLTGNDNNVISYCDIGPAGSNLPSKAIFSNGTTSSTGLNNSGDTIRNCNIYDYFNSSAANAGIYLSTGTTDFVIKDNRFYQTALRTMNSVLQHSAVWISNAAGNNFLISGNTIGYSASNGTGTYSLSGVRFHAISLTVDSLTATSVQGNNITEISASGDISGSNVSSPFLAIHLAAGKANIGNVTGNNIGSQTQSNSITFNSTSTGLSEISLVYSSSTRAWSCNNNLMGGMTSSNPNGQIFIYIIRSSSTVTAAFDCTGNVIGGTTANSIYNTATASSSRVQGIFCPGSPSVMTGNVIRNLTAAGGNGGSNSASAIGIVVNNSSTSQTISRNEIYNLKNEHVSIGGVVTGIYFDGGSVTNLVSRNFIHSLTANFSASTIQGINVQNGTTTFQNNMIQLGLDTSGSSYSIGSNIYGINESNATDNFYFNSVYIGGTVTSGNSNTYAFSSSVTNNTRIYQNNIFYNARSNNSTTGKHYAVSVGGTTQNPPGLTINNNIYLANETGGVFGRYNNTDRSNLTAWQAAVAQDANSFESNPQFINPNGSASNVDLHINPSVATAVEGNGFDIVSITDDYDGQIRSGLTPVDIGADAGNFITATNVNVSGAISGNGNYFTIAAAFSAINAAAQTSANIVIRINGDVTEPVTGAVLNAGAWSSLLIQPNGGGARTITANVNAGLPLIDLNGADNVTMDGLKTEGNSLTISNTTVSSTAGTSTIRFQTDATNNKITNCSILGSSTTPVTNNGGTIWFAASSTLTGNDNNVISYCDIGPAGSNLPSKAFFSNGTTSSTALNNSGDTIRNCNIYDYFNSSASNAGIYLYSGTTDFVIKDNRFYQTLLRTMSSVSQHSAIWINNTSGNSFLISGNTIGYSSSSGTGTYLLSDVRFHAISLTVDSLAATSVQGNNISAISINGDIFGSNTSSPFLGIHLAAGKASIGNVTGNTIGSQTQNNSIIFNSGSASLSEISCVYSSSTRVWSCSNNLFGGIACLNANGQINLYIIRSPSSTASSLTCSGNIIGGTTSNSIYNLSLMSTSRVQGILCPGSASVITGNVIRNLTAAGGNGSSNIASTAGIVVDNTSTPQTITGNEIYNLRNEHSASSCVVTGIFFEGGSVTNLISRNFIHSLTANFSGSTINGIHVQGGTTTFQNNMIQLGLAADGNSYSTGSNINGINENTATNNFYFNSIYIGGTVTSGNSNTYAFNSTVTNNTRIYQNNIFYNARSNSSTSGKHYAVRVGGNSPNPSGLTINYNVYLANGSGGVFGSFNNVDRTNLAAWKTAVGQDANSYESNPQFINPNGSASSVDLHINPSIATAVEANGFDIASITDDYDGQKRSGLTPVDIGADAGNFTPLTQNKTLNLTMFIQGFYNSGTNTMVRDTLRVYLRNSASPYAIIDSSKVYLTASGTGAFSFSNASNGVPYYLHLKHRNSIETWSKTTQQFISDALSYSFTTAASQAYGDNMIQVNGSPLRFGIFSGDVNQDGNVDALDVSLTDNDAFNFASGYVNTDVNGDNVTDAADIAIVDNNAFNFVGKVTP